MRGKAVGILLILSLTPACSSGGGRARVDVLAAASLAPAITAARPAIERRHPNLVIRPAYAGSQVLAEQIRQDAPATVFVSADPAITDGLYREGLIAQPVVFARNTLTIAVRLGNPNHIAGLADLDRPGLVVVLADPAVPVGRYAREVLRRSGVAVSARSFELDAAAAVAKVASGEADATITYVTEVRARTDQVTGVAIPASVNLQTDYTIAGVRASRTLRAGLVFVDEMRHGAGRRALRDAGFGLP